MCTLQNKRKRLPNQVERIRGLTSESVSLTEYCAIIYLPVAGPLRRCVSGS